jgi:peptidoglycan/LPS O-acetylase OafA/YrhL
VHYRPYLDGLRTVAVYLVVAFHAGFGLLSGGFIGVDIFFVLSGFLVTQILVRDLASLGCIQRRRFYARRVRRILPAAVLALIGTAIAYSVVASPAERLDALGGCRAAFLYVANWYFIRQATDYFAVNVNTNPVLHFWSLAIEEQFYLVWPMLLGGLYLATARFGPRRWWVLRMAVVAASGASAIAALHLATTNLERAYYGTDTRAYQLLAGAALALTPQLLRLGASSWWDRLARWASPVALAGLVVLATSLFDGDPVTRGVLAVALAVALLVALESSRGGLARRVLSSRPFTYLGRISYGVYLWHWPVIVIAAHGRSLSPIESFAIACALATVLAAISFHVMEHPIRVSEALDRYKTQLIAIGLATSILCGVVAIPVILDSGRNAISALPGAASSPSGPKLLDWHVARIDIPMLPDCLGKPVEACTVVSGDGLRVVLMGDSIASTWIPAFTEIAKERGWNLSVLAHPTCPWQDHLQVLFTSLDVCRTRQADWYNRVIPELDPGLVILAHQAFDNPARPLPFVGPDGGVVRYGSPQFEPTLIDASSASLRALERPGRRIVILEPTPEAFGTDPLSCVSLGRAGATCAYQASAEPTPLTRYYRSAARRPDITSLDLDRLVCPRFPTCDAIVGDIIVKRDPYHLTATFSRSLAPQIGALIPK